MLDKRTTTGNDYSILEYVGLVLLTAFAAGLFFHRIGMSGFSVDERNSWYFTRDWREMWNILRTREANMWLYYLCLHGWVRLFGESAVAMRSLSALAAVACVPVVYVIARLLMHWRVAVAAALLLVFSPFMVRYAQEARSYSLLCLMSAVSTLLFIRIYFYEREKVWPYYAFITAAGVWFHFHGVFVPVAHFLFVSLYARRWRVWSPLIQAWFLIFLLALPIFFVQPLQTGQTKYLNKPIWQNILDLAMTLQGGKVAWGILSGWFVGVTLVEAYRWKHIQQGAAYPSAIPFLLVSVISPVAVVYVLSHMIQPLWQIRYFTFVIPAFSILVPVIFDRLPLKPWLFGMAVLSLLIAQASMIPFEYDRQKDSWDNAVRHIAEQSHSQDGVMVEDAFYISCYLHAGLSIQNEPSLMRHKSKMINPHWLMVKANRISIVSERYPRIWLVIKMGHSKSWSTTNGLLKCIEKKYDRKEHLDFGELRVFLFVLKSR